MRIPQRIQPLVEEGFVDGVNCQLMSGKEAMICVVRCGEKICCAKVYKEINERGFRQSADYPMELVARYNGVPASRLNDVLLTAEQARRHQVALATQLVLMLCAGAVQGDLSVYLSGYNVLAGRSNIGARSMLVRDMNNIPVCLGRPLPRFWVPTTAAKSGRSTGQGSCIRKST